IGGIFVKIVGNGSQAQVFGDVEGNIVHHIADQVGVVRITVVSHQETVFAADFIGHCQKSLVFLRVLNFFLKGSLASEDEDRMNLGHQQSAAAERVDVI